MAKLARRIQQFLNVPTVEEVGEAERRLRRAKALLNRETHQLTIFGIDQYHDAKIQKLQRRVRNAEREVDNMKAKVTK